MSWVMTTRIFICGWDARMGRDSGSWLMEMRELLTGGGMLSYA